MPKMDIVCGLDVGNGYTKAKASVNGGAPVTVDLPSTVSYTVGSDIPKTPTDAYMANLANELDCDIVSKGIKPMDAGRVLMGERAVRSGESQTEFNIENHVPKCKDSLAIQLVCGTIAAIAVDAAWRELKRVPAGTLEVSSVCAVALPIEDYMEWKDEYVRVLSQGSHHVHIHNFEDDVTVAISFRDVVVLPEGAAAQYAITGLGPDFLQMALDEARTQGAGLAPEYTGEVLVQAMNTIGIDIGEGTVNFPVFRDGDVSVESSSSINRGYGSVLTSVVAELRNTNYAFGSRKDLADFLLRDNVLPAQAQAQAKAQMLVDKHVRVFCRDVMKEYSNIFRKVGLRTDAVYVYGGGANPVRETLWPMLVEASTLEDGNCLPIVYMDSAYSRDLNRNGLWEAASIAAKSLSKK